MKCIYGREVKILENESGFFVGALEKGKIYCRVSGYFASAEEAKEVYDKYHISQCAENYRCAQEDGQYRI